MPSRVIPLSRIKIVFLLAIAVIFLAAGWWMFQLDDAVIEAHRRYNSPWFVHGVGLAALVFAGIGLPFLVRKLFDSAPGLVLDERGLTDNCSAVSAGFIPWSDIAGFEVRQIHRQKLLYVLLKDPEAYVARFGPLRRALYRANMAMAPSPVAIVSNSLSIGFDELLPVVEHYYAAHRIDR